jgi:predicted metal-dependent phosphoesterase TrpH
MKIDLHLHSDLSDGVFPPEEVVRIAADSGLDVISITDHDSIASYSRAAKAINGRRTKLIRGTELSSNVDGKEIHVLGYFKNDYTDAFREYIRQAQAERTDRITEAVQNLRKRGIPVDVDDVARVARGDSVGRAHLAQVLISGGHVADISGAFSQYLRYSMNIVPRTKMPPEQAIASICASGGIAVWAHPPMDIFDEVLPKLVEAGLRGIEVHNGRKEGVQSFYFERVAEDMDLFVTSGSDWHGFGRDEAPSELTYSSERLDRFLAQF